MPRRKHASAPAPRRTRATAGKQRPRRKPQTAAQRQQRHTTRSCQDELLERHPNPDKILRKPRKKRASVPKASVPKVSDNKDGRALEAVRPVAPGLRNPLESIASNQAVDSRDSASSVEEDSLGSWYRNVGYLAALDDSAIDVLEQILPLLIMTDIKRSLNKSKIDRGLGLRDRNVQLDPCLPADPFLAVFNNMKPLQESESSVSLPELHEKVKKYHVDEWRLDLEKAIKDELEATFQRTVMMSMLDRFRLMYNLKDGDQPVLDFAVEGTWNCPFMPTRALKKDKPDRQRMLTRPKPDISIAFHLRSIIDDGLMGGLPEALKRIMVYEALDGTRTQRAFHFLMIEAKNADKTSNDRYGQLQSLNAASQSLHCLYEFFNEADRKEVECGKSCCTLGTLGALNIANNAEGRGPSSVGKDTFVDRFFKEVRVFTAVPSGRAITIRVHRACPASKFPPPSSHEGRPPFQLMILPDYPLQFEYNELVTLTNDDFSRGRLVDIFKKIMADYGIGQLRPLLKKAAKTIAYKFCKWEEERGTQYALGMQHYSHGQSAPHRKPNSQAVSERNQWYAGSAASSSRPPSRARRASSSASAHSAAAQSTSMEETPNKRRRRR